MKNKITDIFFDLDHTLWDFDKNSALTFDKIFKINDVNVSLALFLKHYEPINASYWKLYREEKINKEDLRFERLHNTFKAINVVVSDQLINQLSEDYIRYLSTFNHIFDGTIELLEYLKPNYSLHIITNGFQEVQQKKIMQSKIAHYFSTVTDSETVGVKKPNPKIFHFALDIAEATIENSIMIGDNYEADILGALNIGLDAICYNYHGTVMDDKIKQVSSLHSIKQFL